MRLLLLGTAAVALSGCSWFGGGAKHHTSTKTGSNGYYTQGGECCKPLSRWNIEAAAGPEFLVGGTALTGLALAAFVRNCAPEQDRVSRWIFAQF